LAYAGNPIKTAARPEAKWTTQRGAKAGKALDYIPGLIAPQEFPQGQPGRPAAPPAAGRAGAPLAVLDTNVLLDCVVFCDAQARALSLALQAGDLRWLWTPAMAQELLHVVARPALARWVPDPLALQQTLEQALAAWGESAAAREPMTCGPRCRDPEDQMFVDLAVAHATPWLITRDRALLELSRPLALHQVSVVTPAQWAARVVDLKPV
jgi:uncharacterized protein